MEVKWTCIKLHRFKSTVEKLSYVYTGKTINTIRDNE